MAATVIVKGAASFMGNHVMSSNGSLSAYWTCYAAFIEDRRTWTEYHIFSKGCLKGALISYFQPKGELLFERGANNYYLEIV